MTPGQIVLYQLKRTPTNTRSCSGPRRSRSGELSRLLNLHGVVHADVAKCACASYQPVAPWKICVWAGREPVFVSSTWLQVSEDASDVKEAPPTSGAPESAPPTH